MIICGHQELEMILSKEQCKYNVIIFTNSEKSLMPFVKYYAKEFHHLPYDDVDHYDLKSYYPPHAREIKVALDWGKDKEDLICACHAGISRSSSIAYLISCQRRSVEEGLKLLAKNIHFPNRLIVYAGSKILENSNIWTDFVKWQTTHNSLDPSQNGKWPTETLIEQIFKA